MITWVVHLPACSTSLPVGYDRSVIEDTQLHLNRLPHYASSRSFTRNPFSTQLYTQHIETITFLLFFHNDFRSIAKEGDKCRNMAPKRQTVASGATASTTNATQTSSSTAAAPNPSTATVALSPKASVAEITHHIWKRYLAQTSQRTFLLDAFMAYLVLVGGVQFVYCVVAGNYVLCPSMPSSLNNSLIQAPL